MIVTMIVLNLVGLLVLYYESQTEELAPFGPKIAALLVINTVLNPIWRSFFYFYSTDSEHAMQYYLTTGETVAAFFLSFLCTIALSVFISRVAIVPKRRS
ncbi:MAG TPA: hypothetical protein VFV52_06190 [Bacilli bacterium]|nr:hypothetical protein [Bacilli bacterium]